MKLLGHSYKIGNMGHPRTSKFQNCQFDEIGQFCFLFISKQYIYLNWKMWSGTLLRLIITDGAISEKIHYCPGMIAEDWSSSFCQKRNFFLRPWLLKHLIWSCKLLAATSLCILSKNENLQKCPKSPWSSQDNMRKSSYLTSNDEINNWGRWIWCLLILGGYLNQGWKIMIHTV